MTTTAPRMIVSDIDGTLLNSQERVTDRLRQVISRAMNAGAGFTLATGRPARWLILVLDQLPVRPVCVCANGAVVYDSARDEVVHTKTLSPEQMAHVVAVAKEATAHLPTHLPEHLFGRNTQVTHRVGFAAERAGISAFDRAEELYVVEPLFTHAWESDEHSVIPVSEIISQSAVKLLVRNPNVTSRELYDAIAPKLDPAIAHISYSWGGGLVEISAPGVSKRSAIEWLLEQGKAGEEVTAEDCIVFGDMPNDLEMIRWAGRGVAMGNAEDTVKAAADIVTDTNNEDGVAKILEQWY